MTNKEPILVPVGLFKAGPDGAGGQFESLDHIWRDIFQRSKIAIGFEINTGEDAPTMDSVIIDQYYDGTIERDPHAAHPSVFVTNYPNQTDRGTFFLFVDPPRTPNKQGYRPSAYGPHVIQVMTAARTPPAEGTASADQTLPPRDFSVENGGVSKTFVFTITETLDAPVSPDD